MAKKDLQLQCTMTGADFYDYAIYDAFGRRHIWRSPAIFAAVFTALSVLCFVMHARRGAVLLGVVLLVVGVGLPAFFLINTCLALRTQTGKLKPVSYLVRLDGEGVLARMSNKEKQEQFFSWGEIRFACRLPRQICIYTEQTQGFLLCGEGLEKLLDAAWARISGELPPDRLADRKNRER